MNPILAYLIFPGFLFTAIVGMLASWIDRKVTARVQWRVGPPLLQPLYDFVKLLGKETIIPKGCSKATFLLTPLFGMVAVVLVSTMVWMAILWPDASFKGDVIVIIYLLMVPSIAVIIGGFASRNPIASLGASREMKLMMADELPFLIAVFVAVIKTEGTIQLSGLIDFQKNGMVFGSVAGVLAMIVAIITMQAKLTLVPFDIPEAETEIMSGPYVEYSGPPLAIFKLTRMMMLFTLPMVLVVFFLGGMDFHGWSILWSILKYVVLLVLIILIRNTNPRLRIDQAVKFLWGPVTGIGVIAVILAYLGI
ncbi:NADH-quinone oxidoreductase subunit H [bacterium]|jgi:NADH-quinone oxidoreductase subunit H|nr:NADH-quinone oxidoreductase subunit H [bacterium]